MLHFFVRISEEVFDVMKQPTFMKYKGDWHIYASDLLKKENYINIRLYVQQQNKRERRVLNESLFACISSMGTDHNKLITWLIILKNVTYNHKNNAERNVRNCANKYPI